MTSDRETMTKVSNCNQKAVESNQAGGGDDSTTAKTIECLRARLLAERAESKSARKEAQEAAQKVKSLYTQLEMEIKQRKEAEAAISEVLYILKAKGVEFNGSILATPADLKWKRSLEKPECKVETKEILEVVTPPEPEVSLKKPVICVGGDGVRGTLVHKMNNINSICDNRIAMDKCTRKVVSSCDPHERKEAKVPSTRLIERQHCSEDIPQVVAEGGDQQQHHSYSLKTDQNVQQGPTIEVTSKLKAMVQQIEEEVHSLPKEEPLRAQLYTWVSHVARVLDKDKELASNAYPHAKAAGTEIHEDITGQRTGMINSSAAVAKLQMQQEKGFTHSNGLAFTLPGEDTSLPKRMAHQRKSSLESMTPVMANAPQYPINRGSEASCNGELPSPQYSDVLLMRNHMGYVTLKKCSPKEAEAHDQFRYSLPQGSTGLSHPRRDCFPPQDIASIPAMNTRCVQPGSTPASLDGAQHLVLDQATNPFISATQVARAARTFRYRDRIQQFSSSTFQSNPSTASVHKAHNPIIQFPSSSPISERGCSPFRGRHPGVHRRSSSLAANFVMSDQWDNCSERTREVHLGNGITLYTD
ncbi:hypothetical protein KP509_32G050700 [Ceratopteris richardii]|uniref:Uncharacterized protein n=1 Tax=Ceratopteris richardii TaxID=49495 RepID=A0A8T2QTW7_CERRI|nr:hypothetical protein KP509_32G050700 [Ceratopteris richardii]